MSNEGIGYTGHQMEEELFGSTERETLEREKKYLSFNRALQLARELQPFDPTDPDPRFASDLHATVADKLGLSVEQYHKLRFYTAIGTELDFFHGRDAWLEFDSGSGKQITTLDVTINPNKDEYKADIIFLMPPGGLDPKMDRKEWLEKIEEVSTAVTSHLQSQ